MLLRWTIRRRRAPQTNLRCPPRPRLQPQVEVLEERNAPAVFNVNSTADILNPPAGTVTLRSAIQQANSTPGGNTINLTVAGLYQITLPGANTGTNNSGAFAILPSGGNLTIMNTSPGTVIVDGNHLDRVFDINPAGGTANPKFTVSMQGFTIQNGLAQPGDGAAGSGGGIRDQGNASLTLTNMIVTTNSASADGGGISMENAASTPWTLTINGGSVDHNRAGDAGGGVEEDGTGHVIISGTQIVGNSSVNQGAGIWLDAVAGGTASLAVTNALIDANTATAAANFGGGIGNAGNGAVTITDSSIVNNYVNGTGGGFGDENNLGTLTVLNSTIHNNTAATLGGGIQEGGPTTIINDSTITNNSSLGTAGGVDVTSTAFTLNNTIIAANTAGPMNFSNGMVVQVVVTNGGAGYTSAPTVVFTNATGDTTGTGAAATATVSGGAVTSVTITSMGSMYTAPPTVSFTGGGATTQATASAFIGGGAPDIMATVTTGAGNFIGINDGNLTGITNGTNGNQIGTPAVPLNPMLGPIGNNGGPTPTQLPLPGSPLIGTGVLAALPTGTTTDQRGFPRTTTGATTVLDIGSVQTQQSNVGANFAELGAYRPTDGSWSLDSNGQFGFQSGPVAGQSPLADRVITGFSPVSTTANPVTPVSGDWVGNGRTDIGDFEAGIWHLDLNNNGILDPGETFQFGMAGDIPVPGNYFGDGIRLAVFRSLANGAGEFIISDSTWRTDSTIGIQTSFIYGAAGDRVVVGDWTGDGITKVGVFRDATAFGAPGAAVFSLDVANHHAFDSSNKVFIFGSITDGVVIGDWNGSGTSKVGVYRPATAFGAPNTAVFSLDETGDFMFDANSKVFLFGLATDKYVTGKWAYVTATTPAGSAAVPADVLTNLLAVNGQHNSSPLGT